MNYFHFCWWKHKLFLALCELWGFLDNYFPVLLSPASLTWIGERVSDSSLLSHGSELSLTLGDLCAASRLLCRPAKSSHLGLPEYDLGSL